MRVTCPNCMMGVEIEDAQAGQTVGCPSCQERFTAPVLMNYAMQSQPAASSAGADPAPSQHHDPYAVREPVDPQAGTPPPQNHEPYAVREPVEPLPDETPPPYQPPQRPTNGHSQPRPTMPQIPRHQGLAEPVDDTPEPTGGMAPFSAPSMESGGPAMESTGGYDHISSIPIKLSIIQWLPIAFLGLALLFTFANWVGLYPAGYPAYTQSAWGALAGGFYVDPASEKILGLEDPIYDNLSMNLVMFLYLVTLIAALTLAVVAQVWPRMNRPMPQFLESIWPIRMIVLVSLTGACLLLLLLQLSLGLGLEDAITQHAQIQAQEEMSNAIEGRPPTPEEIQAIEINAAMETGKYNVQRTSWLRMVVLLHFLALLAVGLELLLRKREGKPDPRVGLIY